MTDSRNSKVLSGIALVVLGLALFALQYVEEDIGEWLAMLVIGGVFVAAYFRNRSYGLLIPGCILLGLGSGMIVDEIWWISREPEMLGLGAGFLGIFAVDSLYRGGSHWWPLIPGGILVALGVAPEADIVEWFFRRGWPLVLVIIGLAILAGALRGGDSSVTDRDSDGGAGAATKGPGS